MIYTKAKNSAPTKIIKKEVVINKAIKEIIEYIAFLFIIVSKANNKEILLKIKKNNFSAIKTQNKSSNMFYPFNKLIDSKLVEKRKR